jgi:hypothetical protein
VGPSTWENVFKAFMRYLSVVKYVALRRCIIRSATLLCPALTLSFEGWYSKANSRAENKKLPDFIQKNATVHDLLSTDKSVCSKSSGPTLLLEERKHEQGCVTCLCPSIPKLDEAIPACDEE